MPNFLFRPLMLLGFFLIVLGVFSWLLVPSWRQSPIGALVLLVTFGLGGYAVFTDMKALWEQIRKHYIAQKNLEQEHTDSDRNGPKSKD